MSCEYKIGLWATSYVVKAGHQLRVEISSSNFGRYDRNLNTGELPSVFAQPIIADQRVFHTAEYRSQITLPIIPRGNEVEGHVQ